LRKILGKVEMLKASFQNTLIVVPIYNCAIHLSELFIRIFAELPHCHILCINDGSTDNSLEIVEQHNVKYINFDQNNGKGYALKIGLTYAKRNGYHYVLTIDADLQHDPVAIKKFLKTQSIDGSDIVMGFRRFNFSNMPFSRVFSNYITSGIISKIVKQEVLDSQCGFRLMNLDFFNETDVYNNRFQMETEILIRYLKRGAQLSQTEIPVIYNEEKSNIVHLRDIWNFIKVIWVEK
jgi:glycosyltransferase involved in cell wall biosynthesis